MGGVLQQQEKGLEVSKFSYHFTDLFPFDNLRAVNLDSPCDCGYTNEDWGLCVNWASVWYSETLEETSQGVSWSHILIHY